MPEVRLALRRLLAHPAATVASILALACSIGAGAATWSLVSALLVHPLPVTDPDRLLVVGLRATQGREAGVLRTGLTYPFYPYLRDRGDAGRVAAYWTDSMGVVVSADGSRGVHEVRFVTHDFFDVLGVGLQRGRGFGPGDDRRGAPLVALLSHRWWRQAFDSDPRVLGRRIEVSKKEVTIVGVLQRGFRGVSLADQPDLFMPLQTIGDIGSPLTNYFAEPGHGSSPTAGIGLVSRVPDGEAPAAFRARIQSLPLPLPPRPGARGTPPRFDIVGISEHAVPARARPGMVQFVRLLGITVALLLLIGCSTIGMLLLVRTEARRQEFAICLALGASRLKLARGVAAEGALLSIAGAAASLPVARVLFDAARSFQLPGGVRVELLELGLDGRALAAVAGSAVAACLAITAIAAALGFDTRFGDALRSRSGVTPRVTRRRTRALLLTAQVAVALVLVAGAGLFVRSLVAALHLNPGFDTARLVATGVSLDPERYSEVRAAGFFDELASRLQTNPAFASVTFILRQGGMTSAGHLVVNGIPRQFPSLVSFSAVDDRYFQTIGLRPIAGRDFTATDGPAAPRVAIVSESFGRMLADGGNPLGMRVTMPHRRVGQPPDVMEIVGVVPDVMTNVAIDEPLDMYFPLAQHSGGTGRMLTVRAARDADAARQEIAAALRAMDSTIIPSPMMTMQERIGRQMSAQYMGSFVLGALGVIALLLTMLGTFVLAESMATIRMRELGIRGALGATRGDLLRLVMYETIRLAGAGIVAGLFLAWLGADTIHAFLYRVQPLDPLTLGAVATLILLLACAVSLRPALRAARVDVASILRTE